MNPDLFKTTHSPYLVRWGRLFVVLLLCAYFFLLFGCEEELQEAYQETVQEITERPKTNWEKCYGNYEGWRAPLRVSSKIKDLVCQYYLAHPWRTYIHHSGWRPAQLVDWEEKDTYHGDGQMEGKSFHIVGRALDHRGVDYSGMTECQKYLAFRDFYEEIELWRLADRTEDRGFGIYVTTANPFVHEDEVGLLPGEKKGRRWGRIHGKYVAIQVAKDWLDEKIKKCSIT